MLWFMSALFAQLHLLCITKQAKHQQSLRKQPAKENMRVYTYYMHLCSTVPVRMMHCVV
jgi:hypothetical protein